MHIGIRADGGPVRGFGHLVRSATLARELLERGHEVTYVTRTPAHARTVCSDDVRLVSLASSAAETVRRQAHTLGVDVLVLDCGDIPLDGQRALADEFSLVLILDDDGSTVRCDVLVNGHVYARASAYEWLGEEPSWCVGGEYQLLTENLRRWASREPVWNSSPRRALITMGGSDVKNTTPDAIRAFDGRDVHVDVIVGPGFQNRRAITAATAETDASVTVLENPPDLADRMFCADLAVTALGLTAYELLAVATPYVGIPHAPDQHHKIRALRERNAAIVLDEDAPVEVLTDAVSTLIEDVALRRSIFERARDTVGTDGTRLVADRIDALA